MRENNTQAELDILVIDSHGLVREAIGHLLTQARFSRVRTTGTTEVAECSDEPDVIVIEPFSAKAPADASQIVTTIRERYSQSQILVLTHTESTLDAQRCLSAGAHGYLLKRASGWELVDAVQRVARGEEYLQPSLGATLAKQPPGQRTTASQTLNSTECQVLRTLALGHTNAEASTILSFAIRTVEGYRSRIMKKLGLKTRADIVRAAVEMGLLTSAGSPAVRSPELH